MSLTPFEDILSLTTVANEATQQAAKDLEDAKQQIEVASLTIPDDKEALEDEKADWCNEWHRTLTRFQDAINKAKAHGIPPLLSDTLATKMRESNAVFRRWQGDAASRRKAQKKVKSVPKTTTSDAFGVNDLRNSLEEPPSQTLAGDLQDFGSKKTTTTTTSEGDTGVVVRKRCSTTKDASSSAKPLTRKRARPRVEDDEDEDEENNGEDSDKPIVVETRHEDERIRHKEPCAGCKRYHRTCIGQPNRTCDPCGKLKTKCNKSSGRGGKVTVGKEVEPDPTDKAPARLPRVIIPPFKVYDTSSGAGPFKETADQGSLDLPISPHDDETPRKKAKITKGLSGTSVAMVEGLWRSMLALESKLLSTRAFFKDIETRAATAGALLAAQQAELDVMKAQLDS